MLKRSIHGLLLLAIAAASVFVYSAYLGVGLFDRGGDGDHALVAKNLLERGVFDAWYHPPLSFLVLAASFAVGGYSEFVARLSALAFFVLGGFFTFRLGRLLHSADAGVLAAFLYFFSPLLMRGVFTFWMDMMLVAFVTASVYFLAEYSMSGRPRSVLLGGVFAGFAILTKETALLLVPLYIFVFRRDARIRGLLLVMALFTSAWLGGYELLNPSAHNYTLLLPLSRLSAPDFPVEYPSPAASLSGFAGRMDAVVFFFGVAGGAWLFMRARKRSLLPILAALSVLVMFSFSSTRYLKYYFPAAPLLLVFASVGFFELLSFFRGRRLLRFLAVVLSTYFMVSYSLTFFEKLDDHTKDWSDNPKAALRSFVLNNTGPADSLAVVDSTSSDWLEFYTSRTVYNVPISFSQERQYSLIRNSSARYLVVRDLPGIGRAVGNSCEGLGRITGREYGYAIYKCVWS